MKNSFYYYKKTDDKHKLLVQKMNLHCDYTKIISINNINVSKHL